MHKSDFLIIHYNGTLSYASPGVFRQNQLAKMTSDLCEDGGDKQREKETPAASKASSVSPLRALELPGPWNSPLSPVTPPLINN